MGRIAVVDRDNRFVRWTDRAEIHADRLIHRSVHVALFHPDGRMLIQRRHPEKTTYPDHWDIAVAGHVEEPDYTGGPDEALDEVYADVAARELHEELGITAPLQPLTHCPPEPNVHYEQARLFTATHPGPFTLQPEEVVEVRWVDAAGLDAMIADADTPTTRALGWQVGLLRDLGRW